MYMMHSRVNLKFDVTLTSPNLVKRRQHSYHERRGDGNGVPGFLQHQLVPLHELLGGLHVKGRLLFGRGPDLDVVVDPRRGQDRIMRMRLDAVDNVPVSLLEKITS